MNVRPVIAGTQTTAPKASSAPSEQKPQADELPTLDSWDFAEKPAEWLKSLDGGTYRRTVSNAAGALGNAVGGALLVGAGVALGASLGAGLGAVSYGLGIAGAIGGGVVGLAGTAKLELMTSAGRKVASNLAASLGNLAGRAMHALKIPLKSNVVENAENFSFGSLNRNVGKIPHAGFKKIDEAESDAMEAKMKPGDIIVSGVHGRAMLSAATGLMGSSRITHAFMYTGDGKAVESLMSQGVREADFTEIATSKHHAIVLRPDYEEGQAEAAVELITEKVGSSYDLLFGKDNGKFGCSELVDAVLSEAAPQLKIKHRNFLGRRVVAPSDIMNSDGLGVVGEVGEGRSYFSRLMGKLIDTETD